MTGIAGIDLIYPIGRGQRQLIIGDKKTGKTQKMCIRDRKYTRLKIQVRSRRKQCKYNNFWRYRKTF